MPLPNDFAKQHSSPNISEHRWIRPLIGKHLGLYPEELVDLQRSVQVLFPSWEQTSRGYLYGYPSTYVPAACDEYKPLL